MGAYEWQYLGIDDGSINENMLSFYTSPNPFKGGTTIVLSLKDLQSNDKLRVSIYNIRGQLVREFNEDNSDIAPYTEIYWDGRDEQGRAVAAGAYFYKLTFCEKEIVKKMIRLGNDP